MGMKLKDLEFKKLLPSWMQDDVAVEALSKAMDELLQDPDERIKTIRTWDKIDRLNDAELDEMAWELDVDWYDSSLPIERKRETIAFAQQIKAKRGTKWAVERLISAAFGEGYVMEWYEMDGLPYTFYVLTTNTDTDQESFDAFVKAANKAKNERSHIVGVYYYWEQGPENGIAFEYDENRHRYPFDYCGTKPYIATVGFIVKPGVEAGPKEQGHKYGFDSDCDTEAGTYPYAATIGAKVDPAVETDPNDTDHEYAFDSSADTQAGTYPYVSTVGKSESYDVNVSELESDAQYAFTCAGTYPLDGTVYQGIKEGVGTTEESAYSRYSYTDCGTYPLSGTVAKTEANSIATAQAAALRYYTHKRCGVLHCGE